MIDVARKGVRGLLAASLLLPVLAAPASSGIQEADLVRVFRTSQFSKPSPDPSGLAYFPKRRALIVVDSEVDEGPHWAGANVWIWKPGEGVVKTLKSRRFTSEPTDVALGGSGDTMYITDDSGDGVFVWKKGRDDRWGTKDDRVKKLLTRNFGSRDPAGVEFVNKSLFITDGDNETSDHRVYRLRPGPNGRLDGAPPQGDDLVMSFSTLPFGISKPTDVAYHRASGHLFIVSAQEEIIAEITTAGVLLNTYDMSHTSIRSAAGISFAPASGSAPGMHVYVADRGIDNEDAPAENDGRVFEFEL